jgi:hypothetical protein
MPDSRSCRRARIEFDDIHDGSPVVRIATTLEVIRIAGRQTPVVAVLNSVPPQGGERHQATAFLEQQGLTVCPEARWLEGATRSATRTPCHAVCHAEIDG